MVVKVVIIRDGAVVGEAVLPGPAEVGRQWNAAEPLLTLQQADDGVWRLAVAGASETAVRRRHVFVEPAEGGGARVTNLAGVPLPMEGEAALGPAEARRMALPAVVFLTESAAILLEGEGGDTPRRAAGIAVSVHDNRHPVAEEKFDGPVELGRQRSRDEALYARRQEDGQTRWVIARRDETTVGRSHLTLTPLPDGRLHVKNGSDRQPIRFLEHPDLAPQASCELPLPVILVLSAAKALHISRRAAWAVQSLPAAPPPGVRVGGGQPAQVRENVSVRGMIGWLHETMNVMQAAADTSDFFARAARAVVDLVGLGSAKVLMLEGGVWRVVASWPGGVEQITQPSRQVLELVRAEKRTFWELPARHGEGTVTGLANLSVVAAPILSRDGTTLGALYGESGSGRVVVGELEAMLVEVLASAAAAGLARQEQERLAATARVQFEQFFTPALAQQLVAQPDMLEGRDCDVTVLFCDIRGFSRISERLGAAQTIAWFRDVLDRMSACVLAEGGVVDYIGDGVMAMWGAPADQPDHADLACRAALAILDELPALNARWSAVLGGPMFLGVGINSGVAQVGNIGSRHKFKYGAVGHTVNLASRAEGAGKFFNCPALLTGATASRLDAGFLTRRLGAVRVVGIADPVQLHQLLPPDWPLAAQAKLEYEKALTFFERGDFEAASRVLGNWRGVSVTDGPPLVLMSRAVQAMVSGTPANHPVWEMAAK